jgi:SAM-dependent methyltransferase
MCSAQFAHSDPGHTLLGLEQVIGGAAAIRASSEVGVLGLLTNRRATPRQVADTLGLREQAARRLLDALAALGLASRGPDGRYTSQVEEQVPFEGFLEMWDSLPGVLRDGPTSLRLDRPADAQRFYPGLVGLLGEMMAEAARRAAERLARPGLRVLDVGAGAAPWSLAILAREPSCRVTALDLPRVIPVTRQTVEAWGAKDRFEYVAADLFQAGLQADAFDLAMVGNVCHLFSPVNNRRLLSRLSATLRPGGTVAIIDTLSDGQETREQAIYALGLLLRAPEGDVYPVSRYTEWLVDTGYQAVEAERLTSRPPLGMVTARRPAKGT